MTRSARDGARRNPPVRTRLFSMTLIAGALATAVEGVFAQDERGALYPSIFLTSDYRHDGTTLTGHEPTAQLSLFWARPDNFYAGIWASGVDFSDLGDHTTSYELDIYGGYNFYAGPTRLSAELMYSAFPDKDVPGPTYDFYTASLRASRSIEALSLRGQLSFVPEGPYASGSYWRLGGDATYRWNDWLATSAAVGRRWSELGRDRSFWNVGATARWNSLSVDLRYSATNQTFVECGFVDWCDSGVTLTLQIDLWE